MADSATIGPSKPSTPGYVGFDGATHDESGEIATEPDSAEVAGASVILNQAGVRIMWLGGQFVIGVWSDLDTPSVRSALRILGLNRLPIRYLDGAAIPMRYKLRRVDGDPVPTMVLNEMERRPVNPWNVRDRMLKEGSAGKLTQVTVVPLVEVSSLTRVAEKQGGAHHNGVRMPA